MNNSIILVSVTAGSQEGHKSILKNVKFYSNVKLKIIKFIIIALWYLGGYSGYFCY